MNFEDFKLNKQLLNAIKEAGYQNPTEIQNKAIPQILAGQDILGIAQTGTGKTAAYILPLLMKVKFAQGSNPRALILVPTRELVMQVEEVLKQFTTYLDVRFIGIYGGIGPKTQIERISTGIDILVSTPGRLLDLYSRGDVILKEVKTLILDEADKMMDMGFMPQIRRILEVIPVKRQNLLFSATMAEKVLRLTEEFLEFPVKIEITPQATPKESVRQIIYEVPNFKTKVNLLEHLLNDEELFNRVIVFVKTKTHADNLFKFISRKVSEGAKVIHSNKGQNTRINSIEAFKEGKARVLVATDVAARGLDVEKVSHVINFDVPVVYDDYVHRIGRTGRAFLTGEAITFVSEAEEYHLSKIEGIIRMKIPRVPLPLNVKVENTPFVEKQEMALDIDNQKKRENPDFKGAFHEKKKQRHGKKNMNLPRKEGSSKKNKG